MRNSSLVERLGVDNNRAYGYHRSYGIEKSVGEHSKGIEDISARSIGALRKENVGISNDKAGEKPAHQ